MASSLVISIANANDALEVVEVGLSGVEETDHDEVVGSNSGESSSGGGVVVGDWDVALSVHLLELRSNEPDGTSSRKEVRSEPDELVMEDDESLRVVEVAVGKRRVVVHDVKVGGSGTVALLVQDEHATKVDVVSLGVMDIELIHSLDGGDGDGPSNTTRRTITNRDLVETDETPRSVVCDTVDVGLNVKVLALDTRRLEPAVDSSGSRKPTKGGVPGDDGGGASSFFPSRHEGAGSGGLEPRARRGGVPDGEPVRTDRPSGGPVGGGGERHVSTRRFLRNEFFCGNLSLFKGILGGFILLVAQARYAEASFAVVGSHGAVEVIFLIREL